MIGKVVTALLVSVALVRVTAAQEKSLPLATSVKQRAAAVKGASLRASSVKKGLSSPAKHSAPARVQKTAPATKEVAREKRARLLGKFTVVAYGPRQRSGKLRKHTASGTVPTVGRTVAVDPRVIPLESRIYIAGIGERVAEDVGGKIKGKKLDLFLPSRDHCLQFGVQIRDVYLVVE